MMLRLLPLLALALLLAGEEPALRPRPLTWAQPVLGMTLGNVFKVSDDLYRSEQPDREHLPELRRLGIRAVLNLREYHDDADEIRDDGIALFRVAMNAGDMDPAKLAQAMAIIRTAPKPILIHCWHGSDRTGAVVASYRMLIQHWEREAAIDEFKHGGFGYHETWYPNIESYLRTMPLDR